MEVNNTFTSLIADLPYPAKKTQPVSTSKPEETTSNISDKTSQNSSKPNEIKETTQSGSVNILV